MAGGKDTITLKTVPDDVKRILLKEQGNVKSKRNCQFSLPSTIFKIIREWEHMKDIPLNGVPISKIISETMHG